MIIEHFDPYEFGLLIPRLVNGTWDHQVDGFACRTIECRGIYLRFVDILPKVCWEYAETMIDFVVKLNAQNIDSATQWGGVKGALPFEYKEIDPPCCQFCVPSRILNVEGVQWIMITGMKDSFDKLFAFDELVDKEIMLIYPNCD